MPNSRAIVVLRDEKTEGSSGPGMRKRLLTLAADPMVWYWAAIFLTTCLFLHSLVAAGPAWDESEEFRKLKFQLEFARRFLSGDADLSFRSLPDDTAYYGIGSILFPYALSYLIDIAWLKRSVHGYDQSYSVLLHCLTFGCALAAVAYTRRLVLLVIGNRDIACFAGITLLLLPFWTGYGFFDYKDIPVAAGVIAATYYAAAYLADGDWRISLCFFLALVFIGIQKLAAIPLVVPASLTVAIVVVRQASVRRLATVASQAILALLLLYAATPPAWPAPADFAITSLIYSSQHKWAGCTLTAGQCIGREVANGDGYSVLKYLGLWFGVKLPVLVWAGLLGSIYVYVRKFRRLQPGHHLLAAALCWPISAMAIRNSTLYDGVRHVLFLVPLAVSAVFVLIPAGVWLKWRWWLAVYFVFLVIDSIRLQPYQYVWFNEPLRFFANDGNFETDYWGYSLREAVSRALVLRGPVDWIVGPPGGNPDHLVRSFAGERFASSAASVPPGVAYYVVSITRMNRQAPERCDRPEYVTRRQLFTSVPLRLSFVARCERK